MAGEITARRHARAVFQIALERGELERWRADLELLASVFGEPELQPLLEDPRIQFEAKAKAIEQSMPELSPEALNLVRLLLLKRRVRIMPLIAEEYSLLVDRQQGVEHAVLTVATLVDEETKRRIAEYLSELIGTKIVLSTKVDPEIIGGFVARVGDKVVDGSVRTRLRSLRNNILQLA